MGPAPDPGNGTQSHVPVHAGRALPVASPLSNVYLIGADLNQLWRGSELLFDLLDA